jgi:DNA-directed RNA polymerase specialized sigma24 family protein
MNRSNLESALRSIRSLVKWPGEEQVPEDELVGRFADSRDEAAFAALVRRFGPAVLRVCYRVLQHSHDAEDAFQATFLVLAREAVSLRRRGSVGPWIHEVAYHTALRVRERKARQRHREERHVPPRAPLIPPTAYCARTFRRRCTTNCTACRRSIAAPWCCATC